jgi:16S rRNA (cytosine1402-N4)-methyltransferase
LMPGGVLAVVTFHSLEDRIVKRFFQEAAGGSAGNRHAPATAETAARFTPITKGAVAPDPAELAANPRSRSAKLRMGRRTAAPPARTDPAALGVPILPETRRKPEPRKPDTRRPKARP